MQGTEWATVVVGRVVGSAAASGALGLGFYCVLVGGGMELGGCHAVGYGAQS